MSEQTTTPTTTAAQTPAIEMSEKDRKLWAMIAHLSSLAGFLVPFGNIIGPLVVWLIKKDESIFVGEHAKEALNFQITVMIAFVVCFVLSFVLLGMLLFPVVAIISIILTIKATVAANKGETFHYPYSLKLVN